MTKQLQRRFLDARVSTSNRLEQMQFKRNIDYTVLSSWPTFVIISISDKHKWVRARKLEVFMKIR